MAVDADYPPTGMFYAVRLGGSAQEADSRFREASGLSVEFATEELEEGGENRFRHKVPSAPRYQNLVLKRGLVTKELPFFRWCRESLQGNLASPIQLQSVQVVLLGPDGSPAKTWNLVNAWPVKWSLSDLNAMEAQVLVESLELSYQYFEAK